MHGACAETGPQRCGCLAMADEAEGADVVEVALAAAFGDRDNVVRIPERVAAGDGRHAVETQTFGAGLAAGSLERGEDAYGVSPAVCADAMIAGEYTLAQVAGVGAQAPLVHAVVGAEGAASFGKNFEFAPAAERQAVGSARQCSRFRPAALKGALGAGASAGCQTQVAAHGFSISFEAACSG